MYYTIVIFTQFLYISVPGIILSIKPKTILYMTQLTSLNTRVLYTMVIYTEFLYISVPGIILGIKPKTIAYMTQLTSLNTCVLHHGYIYRISVYFSYRYNSEYQYKNYCINDPVNIVYYAMVIYTEFLYISVPGIILSIKKLLCIYDPVNVSKYMCITPWFYIQIFCMFQFQV